MSSSWNIDCLPGGSLCHRRGLRESFDHTTRKNAKVQYADHGDKKRRREADGHLRLVPIRRPLAKEHHYYEPQVVVGRDRRVDDRDDYEERQHRVTGLERRAKYQHFAHESGGQRKTKQTEHEKGQRERKHRRLETDTVVIFELGSAIILLAD